MIAPKWGSREQPLLRNEGMVLFWMIAPKWGSKEEPLLRNQGVVDDELRFRQLQRFGKMIWSKQFVVCWPDWLCSNASAWLHLFCGHWCLFLPPCPQQTCIFKGIMTHLTNRTNELVFVFSTVLQWLDCRAHADSEKKSMKLLRMATEPAKTVQKSAKTC